MHCRGIIQRLMLLCAGILTCLAMSGQEQLVEYRHPLFEMGFRASPHWDQVLHEENGKVYEVTNTNNNMRINLSYVSRCRNPHKYLKRISGMKGLISQENPRDTLLNKKQALIMHGTCLQGKVPFRRMLVGIPQNKGLYLMEICCPEECYINHHSRVRAIVGSLRVGV